MKLALGTVQLGLPYGNKAQLGVMPEKDAFSILDEAVASGITFYDTAISYGLSEERIGKFHLSAKSPDSLISTKIPQASPDLWQDEKTYWSWISNHLNESKARLGITDHDLLQFHQCDLEFLTSPKVKILFERLLEEKLCQRIGVSVYTPEQAIAAIDTTYVRAVQVPINLVDTRFLEGPFQRRAKAAKVMLIGRSIFMQGVLIESAPLPKVSRQSGLHELRRLAIEAAEGAALQDLAFRLVGINHHGSLDYLLLGIDSSESLRQNLLLYKKADRVVPEATIQKLKLVGDFAQEQGLINPARWND